MPQYRNKSSQQIANMEKPQDIMEKYLKEFRVEQCPLFLQHKCQQHRPFTCFNWHFQNQKRRRPLLRRDQQFNYSADIYCEKYDETTGLCPNGDDCPLLHRTAGDTERRYHLRYYKTGMCVHDTDNRGYCVKNGPHCAFAHGANDLRPPVYDSREQRDMMEGGDDKLGPNSLDKERSLLNDDPKWLDTTYVLANYKTEQCKKPPRLCRQGYACPQFHNNKDRRRSPKKYKYRSTPCPAVKTADEWGDPINCDAGDACQYCHTRTEQQFHPEIYKSTKCNDIQNTSYCPRGAFCAFAHLEQESLDAGPEGGPNFAEILNKALPDSDHSSCDSQSDRSSNSGEMGEFSWGEVSSSRAPGSHLLNGKHGGGGHMTTTPPSLMDNSITLGRGHSGHGQGGHGGHSSIPASPTYHTKLRTSSGDSCRERIRNQLILGQALDDLSITDLYDSANKSRKSSGFSETTKSRNCSGLDNDKSRNCSGNSISQGLASAGFLNSSHPVNIPGTGESLLDRNDGFGLLGTMTSDLSESTYMTGLGSSNLGFSSGLFDFGPSSQTASNNVKDAEICRLREELQAARSKLHSWEESMSQARTACDAWKKEAALANKKAEIANKEKDVAIAKCSSLQKEIDQMRVEQLRRVADLHNLPPQYLKTIEWNLRKDITEVEKALRAQSDQQLWMSNNRLLENVGLGLGVPSSGQNGGGGGGNGGGTGNINDWAGPLSLNLQPIYSQMAQQ